MSGIAHTLNGIPIEEPMGIADFEEELDRDYDRRLIASKYPAELTFTGDGYAFLRSLYDEGICGDANYVATDQRCDPEDICAKGKIILSDIEWNLSRCEAKASLADDGVGARIINNYRVKVFPTANKSKNGVDIAPVAIRDIQLFKTNSAPLVSTTQGFDWRECMGHCVAYITDGELAVTSDWWEALPDDQRYALFNGHEVRTGSGTATAPAPPSYSFDELWSNMWRKHNLFAGVVTIAGQLTLRIEPEDYWFGDTELAAFDHQDELIESVDMDRLYASVVLGSEDYVKDEDGVYPLPVLRLFGFVKEEHGFSGVCNTDRKLDLSSSFVIDTNVIYDAIENNVKTHDEKVFMIQYDHTADAATIAQYLQPGTDPWLYNEQLLNLSVINRFSLPNSIVFPSVGADISFRAVNYQIGTPFALYTVSPMTSGGTNTSTFFHTKYDIDYVAPPVFNAFDPSNSWGNGTAQGTPVTQANSRYTAQAQGAFEFIVTANWQVNRNVSGIAPFLSSDTHRLRLTLFRYNAANTLLQQVDTYHQHTQGIDRSSSSGSFSDNLEYNYTDTSQFTIFMAIGDYVLPYMQYELRTDITFGSVAANVGEAFLIPMSSIETTFAAIAGGDIIIDPGLYRSTVFTFERGFSLGPWVDLRSDPSQVLRIGANDELRRAHLFNAKRNVVTGKTKWKLLTNRAST